MNQKPLNSLPKKPRILSRSTSKENSSYLQTPKASILLAQPPQQSKTVLKQNNEYLNSFVSPQKNLLQAQSYLSNTSFKPYIQEVKPVKIIQEYPTKNIPIKNESSEKTMHTQNSVHENFSKPFEYQLTSNESIKREIESKFNSTTSYCSNSTIPKPDINLKKKPSIDSFVQCKGYSSKHFDDREENEKSNKKIKNLLESIKRETQKHQKAVADIPFLKNEKIQNNANNDLNTNYYEKLKKEIQLERKEMKIKGLLNEKNEIFQRENHFKKEISTLNNKKENFPIKVFPTEKFTNYRGQGDFNNNFPLKNTFAKDNNNNPNLNYIKQETPQKKEEDDTKTYKSIMYSETKVPEELLFEKRASGFIDNIPKLNNSQYSSIETLKTQVNSIYRIPNPFLPVNQKMNSSTILNTFINKENNEVPQIPAPTTIHKRASSVQNKDIEFMVEECLIRTKNIICSLDTLNKNNSTKSNNSEYSFSNNHNNIINNNKNDNVSSMDKSKENDIKPQIFKTKIDQMFYNALNRSESLISKHYVLKNNNSTQKEPTLKYNGDYFNNQKHGFGLLSNHLEQKVYIGEWKYDKYHGQGVLYNVFLNEDHEFQMEIDYKNFDLKKLPWKLYEGEFQNGEFHGRGSINFEMGERFDGNFINGKADGDGTFYKKNGDIVMGSWEKNKIK